jgi:lycopene cyclase domain-containing protein
MRYLYLIIDLCSAIVPFIYSFHPAIGFNKQFRPAFFSLALVSLPFLVWDMYFTGMGVWGFDPRYITGLYIGNLPVEEVMFFLFIPFSCLFTYFTIKKNLVKNKRVGYEAGWGLGAVVLLLTGSFVFSELYYTSWTFVFLGIAVLTFTIFFRGYFAAFIASYVVLLIPFFVTNGILTGSGIDKPVVWYNNNENLSVRVLTIPIEDFFYGMLLILLNVMVFETLKTKVFRQHETAQA